MFNDYVSLRSEEMTEAKLDEVFGKFFGNAPAAAPQRAAVEPKLATAKEKLDAKKKQAPQRPGQKPAPGKPAPGKPAPGKPVAGPQRPFNQKPAAPGAKDAEAEFTTECFSENEPEEVMDVLKKIADGGLDIYDVLNHPAGKAQRDIAAKLERQAEIIAGEEGLHLDDDFEKINDRLIDEIQGYLKHHAD
jgi:hypothetical protein